MIKILINVYEREIRNGISHSAKRHAVLNRGSANAEQKSYLLTFDLCKNKNKARYKTVRTYGKHAEE